MNLSEYQIRKLVDISVAEMEGVAYKIMSKPKYKERLFNATKDALQKTKCKSIKANGVVEKIEKLSGCTKFTIVSCIGSEKCSTVLHNGTRLFIKLKKDNLYTTTVPNTILLNTSLCGVKVGDIIDLEIPIINRITNGLNNTEWWDCLPITKYTKLSNRELFSLLNKC